MSLSVCLSVCLSVSLSLSLSLCRVSYLSKDESRAAALTVQLHCAALAYVYTHEHVSYFLLVIITCVTPVSVHVSTSLCTYNLLNTLVCTYIYFNQCMFSVKHLCVCVCKFPINYISYVCVPVLIQLIHNISAAPICVCTHIHVSFNQYT